MPVNNVSLMGQNPNQAFDLQTQQAQLQQAQKIAEMLIAQGMDGGGSPVIHTAPGNPFARDVANWQGPLSAALKLVMGQYQLGNTNEAQQGLAQEVMNQRQEGMEDMFRVGQTTAPTLATKFGDQGGPGDALANPTSDQLTMTDPGQKGGILASIMSGLNARSPEVRQLANAFMMKQMDLEGKNMVTPEAISSLSKDNDLASLPGAVSRGPLTGAMLLTNPERLTRVPNVINTPLASVTTVKSLGGAAPGAAETIRNDMSQALYNPGDKMPDGSINQTGQTVVLDPKDGPKIIDNASVRSKAQSDVAQGWTKKLEEGQQFAQGFTKSIPAIKDLINLADMVDAGWGANQINDVRRALSRLGVPGQYVDKVKDLQTMVKYALPEATKEGRGLSARITQMEFQKYLENYGADPTADKETLKAIFRKSLINGMNEVKLHNDNITAAGKLPALGDASKIYHVNMPEPGEIFSGLNSGVKFTQDKTTGIWEDSLVGKKKEAVSKTLANGVTAFQGSKNSQRWFTTAEEAARN